MIQNADVSVSGNRRHWHFLVRHEHAGWHGHCASKDHAGPVAEHSCWQRHWHFLFRHRHTETGR